MSSLNELCCLLKHLGNLNLTQATSGNHSLRIDRENFHITRSGLQKSEASIDDFLHYNLKTGTVSGGKPSDEVGLHSLIYAKDITATVIVHVHSVYGTALSLSLNRDNLTLDLTGYEMQKAVHGCNSHLDILKLPVFTNQQDIPKLVEDLTARWESVSKHKAFYLIGHGVYTWSDDLAKVRKAIEGWEFLFKSEVYRRILTAK